MDINQIRELTRLAQESGVGEITVEEEGMRVTVRMPGAVPVAGFTMPMQEAAPIAAAEPTANRGAHAAAEPIDDDHPAHWIAVKAPMVGTFYAAPAPGEPPFVEVGDEVAAGQTLCIVEAMKLMNEIEAEEIGTIREVCVENATPVEFGTVLFYLEPAGNPAPAPETA